MLEREAREALREEACTKHPLTLFAMVSDEKVIELAKMFYNAAWDRDLGFALHEALVEAVEEYVEIGLERKVNELAGRHAAENKPVF